MFGNKLKGERKYKERKLGECKITPTLRLDEMKMKTKKIENEKNDFFFFNISNS